MTKSLEFIFDFGSPNAYMAYKALPRMLDGIGETVALKITPCLLGGIFIKKAWILLQAPQDRDLARSLFKYSILYMMLLSAGMVVDSLPISHQVVSLLSDNLNTLASAIHIIG